MILFAVCIAAAAAAQPKVAVLDAVLQRGIDKAAATAISEKLTERLVLSGRFIVLDRSNVEQVLRERDSSCPGWFPIPRYPRPANTWEPTSWSRSVCSASTAPTWSPRR
ncbi:MAG: CsgG/HfaB family protein [Candidatus Moduliflexus flocculans]|nr:CsgG/HfaB family protein [Candidatus Moduliflexus flocculans]